MPGIPQARNEQAEGPYADLSEHRSPERKLNEISMSNFITKLQIMQQNTCEGSDCKCKTDTFDSFDDSDQKYRENAQKQ